MTKTSGTQLTRRTALASVSAATVAVASGATLAATSRNIGSQRVALAWPGYHHLSPLSEAPAVGETVTLVRERISEDFNRAIAVRSASGRRLGYVPRNVAPEIAAVIDQGGSVPARVADRTDQPVPGMVGWSVLSVDIDSGAAFV